MYLKLCSGGCIKCNLDTSEKPQPKSKRAQLQAIKNQEEINYCQYHCPHPDEPCPGDCPEFKKWRKEN